MADRASFLGVSTTTTGRTPRLSGFSSAMRRPPPATSRIEAGAFPAKIASSRFLMSAIAARPSSVPRSACTCSARHPKRSAAFPRAASRIVSTNASRENASSTSRPARSDRRDSRSTPSPSSAHLRESLIVPRPALRRHERPHRVAHPPKLAQLECPVETPHFRDGRGRDGGLRHAEALASRSPPPGSTARRLWRPPASPRRPWRSRPTRVPNRRPGKARCEP
jgi:hypothetical protein